MTLFMAGHETTAVALSWTWYLLAHHPDVDAKLAEELRAVLGVGHRRWTTSHLIPPRSSAIRLPAGLPWGARL
jgi:cytochrome P450